MAGTLGYTSTGVQQQHPVSQLLSRQRKMSAALCPANASMGCVCSQQTPHQRTRVCLPCLPPRLPACLRARPACHATVIVCCLPAGVPTSQGVLLAWREPLSTTHPAAWCTRLVLSAEHNEKRVVASNTHTLRASQPAQQWALGPSVGCLSRFCRACVVVVCQQYGWSWV